MSDGLTFVCCTADEERLRSCLLRHLLPQVGVDDTSMWQDIQAASGAVISKLIDPDATHEVILVRGAQSLAQGYALGESQVRTPYAAYVHEDLAPVTPWVAHLEHAIAEVSVRDPEWGLLGVYGSWWRSDGDGNASQDYVGNVRDPNISAEGFLYHPGWILNRVNVLDSIVLVKRRGVLGFDVRLPGFAAGVAEDLCLQAESAGRGIWVCPIYTEHYGQHRDVDHSPTHLAGRDYVRTKWPTQAGRILTTTGVW